MSKAIRRKGCIVFLLLAFCSGMCALICNLELFEKPIKKAFITSKTNRLKALRNTADTAEVNAIDSEKHVVKDTNAQDEVKSNTVKSTADTAKVNVIDTDTHVLNDTNAQNVHVEGSDNGTHVKEDLTLQNSTGNRTRRMFKIPTTSQERKEIYKQFYRKFSPNVSIDCQAIIAGNHNEINYALEKFKDYQRPLPQKDMYLNLEDCDAFKKERGYIEHPLTQEELDFPIAFGILVYKKYEQVDRLLRAVYRPQHFYCIHVDLNGVDDTNDTFEAVINIAKCFDNVFVVEDRIDLSWGKFSIVEAELACLKLLWTRGKGWKYYINLTGQELPLKTNFEIVRILKAMDGANVVYAQRHRSESDLADRKADAGKPPHNITAIAGSTHVAVNRDFVNFTLNDQRAIDFIEWLKKTYFPDEFIFSSFNHNPHLGIPGTFLGEPDEYPLKPFFLRYKNWERRSGVYLRKCHGKFVRYICILGLADLSKAVIDIGLYANKFDYEYQPLAYDCLEEWFNEHTWKQFLNSETYDSGYYARLDLVRFQVRKGQDNTALNW